MSYLYLIGLLVSIFGLALLDHRYKLAFSKSTKYFCVILVALIFFLTWDYAGISLGIFFRGQTQLLSGYLISSELPLEELFFLIVLSYTGLLLLKTFIRQEKKRSKS